MSRERISRHAALALAALALLALAGCGRRAKPAGSETATPGAMDSSVHVVVDSTPMPTSQKAVRPFEPVVIPGQQGSGPGEEQATDQSSTPSSESSPPTVSSAPAAPDTAAAGPHKPKVKRRTPK